MSLFKEKRLSFGLAGVLSVHIANLYINEKISIFRVHTSRLIISHQGTHSYLETTVVPFTSIKGVFFFFLGLNFTSLGLESGKDVGFEDMTHFLPLR